MSDPAHMIPPRIGSEPTTLEKEMGLIPAIYHHVRFFFWLSKAQDHIARYGKMNFADVARLTALPAVRGELFYKYLMKGNPIDAAADCVDKLELAKEILAKEIAGGRSTKVRAEEEKGPDRLLVRLREWNRKSDIDWSSVLVAAGFVVLFGYGLYSSGNKQHTPESDYEQHLDDQRSDSYRGW